jgi:hypothetical protein
MHCTTYASEQSEYALSHRDGTQIAAKRISFRGQSAPCLAGQWAHSGFDTYEGSTRPGLLWIRGILAQAPYHNVKPWFRAAAQAAPSNGRARSQAIWSVHQMD